MKWNVNSIYTEYPLEKSLGEQAGKGKMGKAMSLHRKSDRNMPPPPPPPARDSIQIYVNSHPELEMW